jgi:predicted HicB family RNase H-like nuclease
MTMMKKITLSLDRDLLRRVKILAAKKGISLETFLTTQLEEAAKEVKPGTEPADKHR